MLSCWARKPTMTFPQSFGDLIGKIPVPEKVANVCFGGSTRDRLYICGHTSLDANSREYSRRAGCAPERAPSAGEDDGGCPELGCVSTAASRSLAGEPRGIGRETAATLAAAGARVVLAGISTKKRPMRARRRKCVRWAFT